VHARRATATVQEPSDCNGSRAMQVTGATQIFSRSSDGVTPYRLCHCSGRRGSRPPRRTTARVPESAAVARAGFASAGRSAAIVGRELAPIHGRRARTDAPGVRRSLRPARQRHSCASQRPVANACLAVRCAVCGTRVPSRGPQCRSTAARSRRPCSGSGSTAFPGHHRRDHLRSGRAAREAFPRETRSGRVRHHGATPAWFASTHQDRPPAPQYVGGLREPPARRARVLSCACRGQGHCGAGKRSSRKATVTKAGDGSVSAPLPARRLRSAGGP
jgi:hypothetical protein